LLSGTDKTIENLFYSRMLERQCCNRKSWTLNRLSFQRGAMPS